MGVLFWLQIHHPLYFLQSLLRWGPSLCVACMSPQLFKPTLNKSHDYMVDFLFEFVILSVNCNHNHNTNTNITNTILTSIDPQATQGVKILMAGVTATVRAQYDSISSHWYVFFFGFYNFFFITLVFFNRLILYKERKKERKKATWDKWVFKGTMPMNGDVRSGRERRWGVGINKVIKPQVCDFLLYHYYYTNECLKMMSWTNMKWIKMAGVAEAQEMSVLSLLAYFSFFYK